MSYLLLKHIHVTCVVLSGLGFCLRGAWMLRQSPLLNSRLARILPHWLDTFLLGSGLSMAYLSAQYPFAQNWLTAKLFALLAYILFGTIALKRGKTRHIRMVCFCLALLCYAYLISVALSRSPWLYWG